jgi:hypothetical protein
MELHSPYLPSWRGKGQLLDLIGTIMLYNLMFTLTILGVYILIMNRVYCTLHISRTLDMYDVFVVYNYNLFHLLTVCVCVCVYCAIL